MLVYDLVDQQELVEFVRQVPLPEFSLVRWLPNRDIRDLEYRFLKGNLLDQDVAPYRAFDTEAAIGKRPGVSRVSGELPPLSKKMRLGEEARLRLEQLNTGSAAGLADQIFDDAANLVRAVQARLELARGNALYDGKVTIAENGLVATIDFGMSGSHKVAPGILWSTVATATVLADLLTWRALYITDNGVAPGAIVTSNRVLGYMLRNAEVRTLASSVAGTPAVVSQETLRQVLAIHGLPPVETYDTVVRVDGVATRPIPDDRLLMLPAAGGPPLGNTFSGITAEALELRQAGQMVAGAEAGIVAVVDKTFDPVATWTKAAAIAVPVVANPDLVISADVL